MSDIKNKLENSFGSTLSGINTLSDLTSALRIVNGADELEVPKNLSNKEKDEIKEKAREVPDMMAKVIDAYIDSKLGDSAD